MRKKKILFIGGSLNQTTIAHQVAEHLISDYDCFFTPYYCDPPLTLLVRSGLLDFTILGGQFRRRTDEYLQQHHLAVDFGGQMHDYDLVVTASDLLLQRNIRGKKMIMIQEGMTDPENFMLPLITTFKLPGWLAGNTSANGLSNAFTYLCVASEGYRDLYVHRGVKPEKIRVTGIPNFDHAASFLDNDFPYHDYVLAATTDLRETLRIDRRKQFIRRCLEIAGDRQLIFKLHPNENVSRAKREIQEIAPGTLVFDEGNTNHMIANCAVLITQLSSVVYIGLALGKEVHSYFELQQLKNLLPIQNGGTSSRNIAQVCIELLQQTEKGNSLPI